jgi:hypothetical protein
LVASTAEEGGDGRTGEGGGEEKESPWLVGEDDEKDEGKKQHKE